MKSIITQDDELCFICHKAYAVATHHIFQGPNRDLSDDYGLTIPVCAQCHDAIHNGNRSRALMKALHELGQEKWEAYYGPAFKQPRVEFMKIFGRNWLDDDQGETRTVRNATEGAAGTAAGRRSKNRYRHT